MILGHRQRCASPAPKQWRSLRGLAVGGDSRARCVAATRRRIGLARAHASHLVVSILGLITVFLGSSASAQVPTAVWMIPVEERPLWRQMTAHGVLRAYEATVFSPVEEAAVLHLAVDQGQEVVEGQTLLQFESSRIRTNVDFRRSFVTEAKAEATLYEGRVRDLERAVNREIAASDGVFRMPLCRPGQKLWCTRAWSGPTWTALLEARSGLTSAQAEVARAEMDLREASDELAKTVVRAPMPGRVTPLVEVGEYVLKGQPLFAVVNLQQMDLVVSESTDVIRMHNGANAVVQVAGFSDVTFVGRVVSDMDGVIRLCHGYRSSGRVSPAYRNRPYPVPLRSGMEATATIDVLTWGNHVSVPWNAVRQDGESFGVFAVSARQLPSDQVIPFRDSVAEWRPVELGLEGRYSVEVVSGLRVGDIVVGQIGSEDLRSGEQVTRRVVRSGGRRGPLPFDARLGACSLP